MSSTSATIHQSKTKGGTPALLALAISAFGIGTTEFVPVGLLSSIADDLSISITLAGLLITGYAIGVAMGAPVLTALTSKMSRKSLLMSLMLLFIVGNSVAAMSTSFGLLLVARFYWGPQVQVGIYHPEGELQFKTLKEVQPFHWYEAYRK